MLEKLRHLFDLIAVIGRSLLGKARRLGKPQSNESTNTVLNPSPNGGSSGTSAQAAPDTPHAPRSRTVHLVITNIVAVLALIVSILSFKVANRSAMEERSVRFRSFATANARDHTNEGFGLRVTLLNESLRSLIVTSADLYLGDCKLGELVGWLDQPRILDRYPIEPGGVTENLLRPPITVQAREGITYVMMINLSSPCDASRNSWSREWETKRLAETMNKALSTNSEDSSSLSLQIAHDPGGTTIAPVEVTPEMTPRFEWQTFFVCQRDRITGIAIRRKLAAPRETDVLGLSVWGDGFDFSYATRRPILNDRPSLFLVPRLRPGRYLFSFSLFNDSLTSGAFEVFSNRPPEFLIDHGPLQVERVTTCNTSLQDYYKLRDGKIPSRKVTPAAEP